MSTKHTPGPWSAYNKFSGLTLSNWRVSEGNSTPGIGIGVAIMSGNRSDEIEQANARLIAAAPELLEALTELLDFAIEANNRIPSPGTREDLAAGFGCNPFMVAQFKKARAAIAKATAE